MAYGIETYRQDASVLLNGLTVGGVLVDVLRCPATSNGSVDYPNTQAANLNLVFMKTTDSHAITVSTINTVNGQAARISWSYKLDVIQSDTIIFVFNKVPSAGDLYGVHLVNDAGEVLADQGYPSPQYAGKVSPNTTAYRGFVTADGYTANVHSYGAINMRPGADQLLVLATPYTGSGDTWYTLNRNYILSSEGSVTIELTVYTKAQNYQVPTLHLFALNKPVSSGDVYGFRLYTQSQALTFDAASENMGNVQDLTVVVPAYGSTRNYDLAINNMPGITVHPHKHFVITADNKYQTYVAVFRRLDTQLNVKLILESVRDTQAGDVAYNDGTASGWSPVVNLASQAPQSYTGTPAQVETAPSFIVQPTDTFGKTGDTRSFSVMVSGYPTPSLQWYRNYSIEPGATGTTHTFTASQEYNEDMFWCVATNSKGRAESNTVRFYLEDGFTPPYFISVSGSGTYNVGQTISLYVSAGGNPTPLVKIGPENGQTAQGYGSAYMSYTVEYNPAGVQQIYYEAAGQGQYAGQVIMGFFQIYINEAPSTKPVFSTQPSSITVTQGSNATLSASASNTNSYQWYRDQTFVGTGNPHVVDTSTVGTFTYFCIAVGATASTQSSAATVTVNAPAPTLGYASHYNLSGSGSAAVNNRMLMSVNRNGRAYIDSAELGIWGAGGNGDGSMYDVIGSGNFTPGTGSYAMNTRYSLSTGGVGWYTPTTVGTYVLYATIYRGAIVVATVQFTVTIHN